MDSFTVSGHVDTGRLRISYGYHTHDPQRSGGWSSGVPNPDEDGIWFCIDFHEQDSPAAIHTQPVTAPLIIGGKRVSYLILEGGKTRSVNADIHRILARHGVESKMKSKGRDLSRFSLLYANGDKLVSYAVDCPEKLDAVPANKLHGLIMDLINKVRTSPDPP